MMPGMPERRTHDYVRHGMTSLFAAFNIADGTVISSIHRRHRAIEFKKFLAKIDAEVPDDLEVHLVCDNYGTHKTPAINAWLAKHPRFHLHFTRPASKLPGSTRSSAGSASSPTSSSAAAATPPSGPSKPTSAPGPRDGTKTPNHSSGPSQPNRSSSQSDDFLHGSPVRDTSRARSGAKQRANTIL